MHFLRIAREPYVFCLIADVIFKAQTLAKQHGCGVRQCDVRRCQAIGAVGMTCGLFLSIFGLFDGHASSQIGTMSSGPRNNRAGKSQATHELDAARALAR